MQKPSIFSPSTFKRLLIGTLLEFGPILVFLASYEQFHIYKATMLLMIATIISTVTTYKMQKRLPYLALYLAFLTIGFGYLTIMHRAPRFIQMRDTLYDLTCAITLLIGLMINIPFLKIAFHEVIPMATKAWRDLTHAWIAYFVMCALLNEYVRKSYSLDVWFTFKSVMVIATVIFGFTALYLCYEKPNDGQ